MRRVFADCRQDAGLDPDPPARTPGGGDVCPAQKVQGAEAPI
jgi:hypothetical protein